MCFFSVSSSARHLTGKGGGDRGFNISSERFFLVGKTDFPIGSNHQLWKMACKVGLEIC